MILRKTGDHVVAISQPHHAWLAGELARAWDKSSRHFGPRDELVCAVALHDIGWLDWEDAPPLHRPTGLPPQFDVVPAEIHTKLWRTGVERAAVYGDYVALLVSRHGDAIYDMTFDERSARPEAAAAVHQFRADQARLQARLIERIRSCSSGAESVTDEALRFARHFLVIVDTLSLHMCWGLGETVTLDSRNVTGGVLKISPSGDGNIICDPWPFEVENIVLSIAGKTLSGPYRTEADMRLALAEAPITTFPTILRPAT